MKKDTQVTVNCASFLADGNPLDQVACEAYSNTIQFF